MKSLYALLFTLCISLSAALHAQVNVQGASLSPATLLACSTATFTANVEELCANYAYTGHSFNVSGSTINVVLDYTVGPICLPAIVTASRTGTLTGLPAGNFTVVFVANLNGNPGATFTLPNVTIGSCCNAVADFSFSTAGVCLGDTIAVVNNSTGGSSQQWSLNGLLADTSFTTTFSPSNTGTYTVLLTTFGGTTAAPCNDTISKTFQVYSNPNPNLGPDAALCQGRTKTLTTGVIGGYQWSTGAVSPSITVDTVGFYAVTVTNGSGCSGSDTMQITTLHPLPNVAISGLTMLCPNETAILNAGTFAGYLWNTNETSQTIQVGVGAYAVTVTNNFGCTATDSIIVSNAVITPILIVSDTIGCDSVWLEVNDEYINYNWSNGGKTSGVWTTSTGTYTVSVTDSNGCWQIASLNAIVSPSPIFDLGSGFDWCNTAVLQIPSGISAANYLWNDGSSDSLLTVDRTSEMPQGPETFILTVTNEFGCSYTDSIVIEWTVCANVPLLNGENDLTLLTNSDRSRISLAWENMFATDLNWEMLNLKGQRVLNGSGSAIDVAHLPSGLYLITVTTKTHYATVKWIK